MLEISGLEVYYGHIHALKGLSMTVNKGEIVSVFGPNGAGKTTLIRSIAGLIRARAGTITFEEKVINKVDTYKRVMAGVGTVPQGREVFANLTVQENILMGAYTLRKDKSTIRELTKQMFEVFPRLKERVNQKAGTLSGGEQQMLAVCRALMSKPRLLLLDEPSLGLSPLLIKELFDLIKRIREMGTTILLVEQNVVAALKIANRGYILETGAIVGSGTAKELANSQLIKESYLA